MYKKQLLSLSFHSNQNIPSISVVSIIIIADRKNSQCYFILVLCLPICYVCVVVNSSTQKKRSKLQPLQNKAVRIIEKCKGYIRTSDMEKLHDKLHLKMLYVRRKTFMLKMMYKLSKTEDKVDRYRPEMLLRTGPKVKMKIAFTDKEKVKKSPYYLCNQLWERLESNIQLSSTLVEFKNNLRRVNVQLL